MLPVQTSRTVKAAAGGGSGHPNSVRVAHRTAPDGTDSPAAAHPKEGAGAEIHQTVPGRFGRFCRA